MSIKTWFAEHLNPKHWTVKTRVVVASVTALALALAGGGVGAAFALRSPAAPVASPSATPTATASPTPSPTPTPEPVTIDRTATAVGAIAGWSVADRTQLAGVLPQVGDAADGEIAVTIDAPVVPEPRPAIAATVDVQPATEYTFRGQFRLAAELPEPVEATLHVGGERLPLPALSADWTEVDVPYETRSDESSVAVVVTVDGPVRGLDVDAFSLAAADGQNVLPNPSFEDVQADWGIRNDVLVLQQQTAALAVRMEPGDATWVARRPGGDEVARGAAPLGPGLSAMPLEGLPQGYYDITVTDAAGETVTAPVGLIDMPTSYVPTDARIGAHLHAQKDFNADGAIAAASLGMGIIRLGDNWQQTEPSPGQYSFSEPFGRAFGQADARGMEKLIITGRYNPAYDGNMPPSSAGGLEAYGRYAAALVQHFDPDAVEVFNEFNIPSFNKGMCGGDAACYAPILNAAHDAIKAVKPELPVIGGVTGNFDGRWYDVLWQNGGLENVDAISFHPYQVYGEPEGLAGVLGDARRGMDAHGGAKPIWITELGWTTKVGDVSLEQQANMVIRAEITALANGVERYLWYDLVNDETDPAAHEGNFGQFWQKRDGLAAFPPKPSAFTQALMLANLAGRDYLGMDDTGVQGVRSARFGDEQTTVRYVWTRSGEATVEYEADGPITVTTAQGDVTELRPEAGKVTVPVSTTPRILTGAFSD